MIKNIYMKVILRMKKYHVMRNHLFYFTEMAFKAGPLRQALITAAVVSMSSFLRTPSYLLYCLLPGPPRGAARPECADCALFSGVNGCSLWHQCGESQ